METNQLPHAWSSRPCPASSPTILQIEAEERGKDAWLRVSNRRGGADRSDKYLPKKGKEKKSITFLPKMGELVGPMSCRRRAGSRWSWCILRKTKMNWPWYLPITHLKGQERAKRYKYNPSQCTVSYSPWAVWESREKLHNMSGRCCSDSHWPQFCNYTISCRRGGRTHHETITYLRQYSLCVLAYLLGSVVCTLNVIENERIMSPVQRKFQVVLA